MDCLSCCKTVGGEWTLTTLAYDHQRRVRSSHYFPNKPLFRVTRSLAADNLQYHEFYESSLKDGASRMCFDSILFVAVWYAPLSTCLAKQMI